MNLNRSPLAIGMAVALAAGSLSVPATSQATHRTGPPKYLIAWLGDQMLDGNNHSPLDGLLGLTPGTLPDADFLAIIDANPRSPTYGQVVNTAEMPAIYGQHLLSVTEDFVDEALDIALCNASTSPTLSDATGLPPDPGCSSVGLHGTGLNAPVDDDILGGVPNFNYPGNGLPPVVPAPSSVLNEPHHHSVRPYVDPDTGRVQAYFGGLISANVFGCDITDPLHIVPSNGSITELDAAQGGIDLHGGSTKNVCGLSVSGAVNNFVTGTDDLEYNPVNGNYYTTMMGAGGQFSASGTTALSLPPVLTTPGGLQQFDPATDAVIGDYSAVPTASVYGHGHFTDGRPMLGPKRYAPRVQLGFGGVDGNGECANADILTGAGVTANNLCGMVPNENHIGADTGAVDLDAGINEGPDTGLLAHPHGIGLRSDLQGTVKDAAGNFIRKTNGIIMTSDYADPVSLALTGSGEGAGASKQNLGTTIRLWDLENPAAGPYQVIQMPDGNRHEDNAIHEEPEGLMAMRITHSHKGAFVASMCGGTIYYAPDITVAKPEFKIVYDFGACTGASVFTITQDDGFMFVPISGIQTDGDPIHDRDYAGEHNRRIAVLDIRRLLWKGKRHQCDASPPEAWDNTGPDSPLGEPITHGPSGLVYANWGDRFHGSTYWPNNGHRDCPKLIDDVDFSGPGEDRIAGTSDDHPDNETSRGGPHFTTHDRNDRYVATSNYFVDLREYAIKDVDLLLTALGLGHAWDNGSGGAIPNAYPPGGPNPGDFPPGGLGNVHAALGIDGGRGNTLPGTGSVGDDTICMMKWNRWRTNLKLDTRFNAGDAASPDGCIDMDFGDTGSQWPANGARHPQAGNATPHGMSFITVGSDRFFTNGEL